MKICTAEAGCIVCRWEDHMRWWRPQLVHIEQPDLFVRYITAVAEKDDDEQSH